MLCPFCGRTTEASTCTNCGTSFGVLGGRSKSAIKQQMKDDEEARAFDEHMRRHDEADADGKSSLANIYGGDE